MPPNPVREPAVRFPVVPDRLLDGITDDALAAGVARLNGYLPEGASIDIAPVEFTRLRQRRLSIEAVPVSAARRKPSVAAGA